MSTSSATSSGSSSTPILDRLLPPPPPMQTSRKGLSGGLLVFLISCWVGLIISSPKGIVSLQRILSPTLALFAGIAVHELGHAIAGKLAGFRLTYIQVGPLQIVPPFHLRWRRKVPLPGASGLTVQVPRDSHKLRSRAIIMLLGGPAANMVTALALLFLWPNPGWFSASFIFFSAIMGFTNLLPFRRLALHSDGQRILTLLRNSRQGERWLALLQLIADMQKGVNIEDLRSEFIAIATAVQDKSPDTVSAHNLAYAAAFYKRDNVEAARLLEICLQYSGCVGPFIRESVFTDAAIFQALRRKRVDLAEQWLADIPEKPLMPELGLEAQAAILEGQGDIPGALKKLDEAEAVILKLAEPYRRDLSLRSVRRWRAELLNLQPPPKDDSPSLVSL